VLSIIKKIILNRTADKQPIKRVTQGKNRLSMVMKKLLIIFNIDIKKVVNNMASKILKDDWYSVKKTEKRIKQHILANTIRIRFMGKYSVHNCREAFKIRF
tara:strand:+ start:1675 stop:1977 length:303 start_codon:yes stop_codon:yes gene_type:complete